MQAPIRVGIVGYGNLGRGVEYSIRQNPDMELVAVFTRRSPESVNASVPAVSLSEVEAYKGKIDVMILAIAKHFTAVDSFDTHARIPEYFEKVNAEAEANGHISVISTGWDPGLFSLNRLLFESVLPEGNEYTFWGRGVSQGHSDAVRRIEGVKAGVQYTIPSEEAVAKVRAGENPELSTRDKHIRECFVVAEEGADQARIEEQIKTMPNYFADYNTIVNFISEEELKANHSAMPHGGLVFRSGVTGNGSKQIMEFGLNLGSNPEFTSSVLVAYARAAHRLAQRGESGARTVFDIPFGLLSPKSAEDLRSRLL